MVVGFFGLKFEQWKMGSQMLNTSFQIYEYMVKVQKM